MKFLTISKRIFLVATSVMLCSVLASGQVGVNTTSPNASSALDITSTDKGFLMTKVALTGTDDNTTITPNPTTGLLVYNTATAGTPGTEVVPGFYYFNGSSWRRFYTQGYTLSYDQTAEITASTTNTDYVILPGLDTGNITVPFSGTYQIRVEGYYAAGNLISTTGDGAAQGSISLAMSTSGGGGGAGDGGCVGGITAYPYNESFESGLGAWTQSAADFFDWTRNSGGTGSSNTGPSSASAGSFYMYTEASSPNYPNRQTILNSPCFDLGAASSATFSFDYHMYGASDMGTFSLEASDDNGASWTSIWSQTGNQGNSWITENVNMSAYTGSSVQLRFNRTTGSTWQADIAIDNVSMIDSWASTLSTVKETYLTTSSKRLGSTTVNNLAQSATILVNMELNAGVTYRFAVRGREWLANNTAPSSFGKNTSSYSGNSVNDAQRGTMTISLIKQF